MFTLARWLGPWASADRAPEVEWRDDTLDGTAPPFGGAAGRAQVPAVDGLRVRIYGTRGSPYLIAPGLHYAGADDPRMDRFCRILAAAGHVVIAPFIPSFLALSPEPEAIVEFVRVADAIARWTDRKPVVFSISFGSLLAFAVAAERPDAIARLVIFGGYLDFGEVLAYCLTGERRDPLNQPAVLMNLLDFIAHDETERAALVAGWLRYVERVWGRAEMKRDGRYLAIAEELAPTVPDSVRELFLVGTGVRPGAWELARPAIATSRIAEVDPRPYLARIHGRVDLVHGTDDDVIPYTQSHALAAALAHADVRVHITGLYGHTGATLGRLAALPRELATMLRVLRVLA